MKKLLIVIAVMFMISGCAVQSHNYNHHDKALKNFEWRHTDRKIIFDGWRIGGI